MNNITELLYSDQVKDVSLLVELSKAKLSLIKPINWFKIGSRSMQVLKGRGKLD